MSATRPADYVVFGTCLLVIPFLFGMGAGRDQARKEIATVCEQQPGAVLVASYQDPKVDAIACSYMDAPPVARPARKAKARQS